MNLDMVPWNSNFGGFCLHLTKKVGNNNHERLKEHKYTF